MYNAVKGPRALAFLRQAIWRWEVLFLRSSRSVNTHTPPTLRHCHHHHVKAKAWGTRDETRKVMEGLMRREHRAGGRWERRVRDKTVSQECGQ